MGTWHFHSRRASTTRYLIRLSNSFWDDLISVRDSEATNQPQITVDPHFSNTIVNIDSLSGTNYKDLIDQLNEKLEPVSHQIRLFIRPNSVVTFTELLGSETPYLESNLDSNSPIPTTQAGMELRVLELLMLTTIVTMVLTSKRNLNSGSETSGTYKIS